MTLEALRATLDSYRKASWSAGDVIAVVRDIWGEPEPRPRVSHYGDPTDRLRCPNCSSLMRYEQVDDGGRALREKLAAAERACEMLLIQVEHRGMALRWCARRNGCGQAQLALLEAAE